MYSGTPSPVSELAVARADVDACEARRAASGVGGGGAGSGMYRRGRRVGCAGAGVRARRGSVEGSPAAPGGDAHVAARIVARGCVRGGEK